VVRHGADKAVVSCVFESTPGAEAILEANGIDAEGHDIILRREILSTGKGRVFVNNQPATVPSSSSSPPSSPSSTRNPRRFRASIPGPAAHPSRPLRRHLYSTPSPRPTPAGAPPPTN
jgi:hypothetical protein